MANPGPLSGVRVIDLSAYIAAPYGCTLLADQGAEVIKVEPPGGDNLRKYPSTLQAEGRAFLGVNRGKSGIVLDLKMPAAREVLLRLLRDADVLVHNFRPGVPERLGIGCDAVHALNPRLVYCAVTGYGDRGPMKDKAGYDQVLQSMTGICALQGTPQQPEIVYGSVVDYYAAALLASGVDTVVDDFGPLLEVYLSLVGRRMREPYTMKMLVISINSLFQGLCLRYRTSPDLVQRRVGPEALGMYAHGLESLIQHFSEPVEDDTAPPT